MNDSSLQPIAQWIRAAFFSNAEMVPPSQIKDWDAMILCARHNAVAPLLYAALKNLGCVNDLPSAILEQLRLDYLRADTANWNALRELQSLAAQFKQEKIPVVILKGGALAASLYGEPALRPMDDLDLLIPREQFARADEILRAQNFSSPPELCPDFAPRLTNYRAYTRGGNRPAHVEIHWHLFKSPYYWRRVPIEWFWEHVTEDVFTPQAQLLHLAAHFALHHRAERLIWSHDIARLLLRDGAAMDWDTLLAAVERFGLGLPVRTALARVAETWGVSVSSAVMTRLNATRSGWPDRAAFAVMNAERNEARFVLDAIFQRTPGDAARFVWYHLFPARAYMRERYHVRDDWKIPFFQLWRLLSGILKFFRSAWLTIKS